MEKRNVCAVRAHKRQSQLLVKFFGAKVEECRMVMPTPEDLRKKARTQCALCPCWSCSSSRPRPRETYCWIVVIVSRLEHTLRNTLDTRSISKVLSDTSIYIFLEWLYTKINNRTAPSKCLVLSSFEFDCVIESPGLDRQAIHSEWSTHRAGMQSEGFLID